MGMFDFLRRDRQEFAADERPDSTPAKAGLLTDQVMESFVSSLFDLTAPDQLLADAGKTRRDLETLMDDDEIGAACETRMAAVQSIPWALAPYDEADPRLVWTWDQISSVVEELIAGAWTAVPYGYSVMEVIYREEPEDSPANFGLSRVSEKPFWWFTPRQDGTLIRSGRAGSYSNDPLDTFFKFLVTVNRPTYLRPDGHALFIRLYWPWFFRSQGWRFWARFLERHGAPLMTGATKSNNVSALRNAMQRAIASAVLAHGKEDEIKVHASAGNGESFDKFITASDKRIQKVILGQTLTSDVQGGGSYAAAKVHDLVRHDRTLNDMRLVVPTVNQLIRALWALNWPEVPAADVPVFKLEAGEGLAKDRAERDAQLVGQAGIRLTEQYFLTHYDFEPGDFEIVEPGQQGAAAPGQGGSVQASRQGPGQVYRFQDDDGVTSDQRELDRAIDRAIDASPQPVDPAEIRNAILAASDEDDLAVRLRRLFQDNPPESMAAFLSRALVAAEVRGLADATEDQADG